MTQQHKNIPGLSIDFEIYDNGPDPNPYAHEPVEMRRMYCDDCDAFTLQKFMDDGTLECKTCGGTT